MTPAAQQLRRQPERGGRGFPVTVKIVSTGGVFYAQTPLSSSYDRADPSAYGFGDPAQLLDPSHGLSSLLTACTGATNQAGRPPQRRAARRGGLLDPGHPGCQAAHQRGRVAVRAGDRRRRRVHHQLRRVALVGPFFEKAHNSTFTVVLDKYGENVTITPPAAEWPAAAGRSDRGPAAARVRQRRVLLGAADTYVVVIALPAIMSSVGVDLAHLAAGDPIISGFLVGYVAVLPLLGRLSDLYGARRCCRYACSCSPAARCVTVGAHSGRGGGGARARRAPAAVAWCR